MYLTHRTRLSRHLGYRDLLLTEEKRGVHRQYGYAGEHCATKVLTRLVSIPGQSLCPAHSSALNLNLRYDIFSPYDDRTDSVRAAHHRSTHRPVFSPIVFNGDENRAGRIGSLFLLWPQALL